MPRQNTIEFEPARRQTTIFSEGQSRKKLLGKQGPDKEATVSPKNQILYVEASNDIRELTVTILELEGYTVFSTDSAAAFEALAGVASIDLYLIGDYFPLGSNLDLIRQIKARDCYTPLMVHSTQTYAPYVESCRRAGAQAFIDKLSDVDCFRENIRMLISKPEARSRGA